MKTVLTLAEQILNFYDGIESNSLALPEGYRLINPFAGTQKVQVKQIAKVFYHKYYNDNNTRRIILGSSPARRGTAVTGIPFEDATHLQTETGIVLDNFYINKSSSNFLYDVMSLYGGRKKFYSDFYMNFICPLGIVRSSSKGNEVNCNYYENRELQKSLMPFIISKLQLQMDFGIDKAVCYCIGSGENYRVLSHINKEYGFFDKIIPLEHPRFIMQYNSHKKDLYLNKYLHTLHNS